MKSLYLVWLTLGLTASACTPDVAVQRGAAPRAAGSLSPGYPGQLRRPDSIGYGFQWRQQVTASWGAEEHGFDAVLAQADGELQLLGLNPMGMVGFVLKLDAQSHISFDNRTGQDVPFEPRYILLDVQRAFYPWLPPTQPSIGSRSEEVGAEVIEEQWEGGHLVRRSFRRLDGKPSGVITVDYRDWHTGEDAARQVLLRNGWFGYTLEIRTLEQQRL